jgi:hypothetical protein
MFAALAEFVGEASIELTMVGWKVLVHRAVKERERKTYQNGGSGQKF